MPVYSSDNSYSISVRALPDTSLAGLRATFPEWDRYGSMLIVLFSLADILLAAALFFSAREAAVRLMDRQLTLSTILYSSLFFSVSLILAFMVIVFTTLVGAWYLNLEL